MLLSQRGTRQSSECVAAVGLCLNRQKMLFSVYCHKLTPTHLLSCLRAQSTSGPRRAGGLFFLPSSFLRSFFSALRLRLSLSLSLTGLSQPVQNTQRQRKRPLTLPTMANVTAQAAIHPLTHSHSHTNSQHPSGTQRLFNMLSLQLIM